MKCERAGCTRAAAGQPILVSGAGEQRTCPECFHVLKARALVIGVRDAVSEPGQPTEADVEAGTAIDSESTELDVEGDREDRERRP